MNPEAEAVARELEEQINRAVRYGDPLDEASWGYEYGVLLTVNEARVVLAALRSEHDGT